MWAFSYSFWTFYFLSVFLPHSYISPSPHPSASSFVGILAFYLYKDKSKKEEINGYACLVPSITDITVLSLSKSQPWLNSAHHLLQAWTLPAQMRIARFKHIIVLISLPTNLWPQTSSGPLSCQQSCYVSLVSKAGSQTNSINITQDLVRNADS